MIYFIRFHDFEIQVNILVVFRIFSTTSEQQNNQKETKAFSSSKVWESLNRQIAFKIQFFKQWSEHIGTLQTTYVVALN